MIKELKLDPIRLQLQEEAISKTCEWWTDLINNKVQTLESLQKKINTLGKEEDIESFENIQNEINHLILKGRWEEREVENFQKRKDKFFQEMHGKLIDDFSDKISNSIKKRKKK